MVDRPEMKRPLVGRLPLEVFLSSRGFVEAGGKVLTGRENVVLRTPSETEQYMVFTVTQRKINRELFSG